MNKEAKITKPTTSKTTAPVVKDKKIAIDIMHFKANRISFWLILLAIALNVAMFIIIYKTNTSKLAADVQLGLDLIVNVVFMLTCFLAAEKTKRYSREWGIVSIVLGGLEIARIFWIPLFYFLNGGITSGSFSACVILLSVGGASMIFAGIIALIKHRILEENAPLLRGAVASVPTKVKGATPMVKEDKPVPATNKKKAPMFSNITYTKKESIDSKFDEFVVTYNYRKYIIHYFIFFLKKDHASINDAKREFNEAVKNGKIKRYTWAFMMKCGTSIEKREGNGER